MTSWRPTSPRRVRGQPPSRWTIRKRSARRSRLTRTRGYSIDDGESSPGVRCLAVAIRGVDGRPLFAISLTGPAGRFTPERLHAHVPEMLAVARALTTQFGGEIHAGVEQNPLPPQWERAG